MKKSLKLFVLIVGIVTAGSNSYAAEMYTADPIKVMNDTRPTVGARGMVFVENSDPGATLGMIRYSHTPTFSSSGSISEADYWDWYMCTSWTDSSCPVKKGFTLEGKVILGSCLNTAELGCIEKLRVIDEDGIERQISLVGPAFSAVKDIPESTSLGIPRSSSPQLFTDEKGQLYLVRVSLSFHIDGTQGSSLKLDVDISPVAKVSDSSLPTPQVVREVIPRTQKGNVLIVPSTTECLATDTGICYKGLLMSQKIKLGADVRVPNQVSGWLRGRVSNPEFSASVFNSTSQIIKVLANPAVMPVAGGWVTMSQLPNNFLDTLYPSGGYDSNPNFAYFLVGSPSQGDRGVAEYVAWSPFFKEKALLSLTTWSYGTNRTTVAQPCMTSVGEVTGFVASNASVYSSNPPTWDPVNSTLTYKVGAPHFDENGRESVGTYTLAMPLSTIKCLYNQNSLPPSATVSLAYDSEVVNVATVTLKSDSGWVYFQANGFHYSNPTIQVKFAKPVANASPSAAPTPNSGSSAPKIQWCAKGSAKKKVTAVNPTCPKGYKKIKAPL